MCNVTTFALDVHLLVVLLLLLVVQLFGLFANVVLEVAVLDVVVVVLHPISLFCSVLDVSRTGDVMHLV